jgi:CxxC motif-containing protein (DUF1111 family)
MRRTTLLLSALGALLLAGSASISYGSGPKVHDPGVRAGAPGAGSPLPGLDSATEAPAFVEGLSRFSEVETVPNGLGPRFNAESCAQCHAQPSVGGSSPFINPQVAIATHLGAKNAVPPFIKLDGPVREVRFPRNANGTPDGGVHDLFVITGRSDLPQPNGCNIAQPDFATALKRHNAIFRIPTPVFGAGLIGAIPDSAILANAALDTQIKAKWGIKGHANNTAAAGVANRSGNDGTITRFGWKAQNKSTDIFAGEAYNVEQGVTNPLFPNERDETPACLTNTLPEDHTNFDQAGVKLPSDIVMFAQFMDLLDAPQPVNQTDPQIVKGRQAFTQVGCAACHTPTLRTGSSSTAALSNKDVHLWSDLLVHHMGRGLRDGVTQGAAGPDEFRSAPLWGLGQRVFFLHDGRTRDLLEAIAAHASRGSEANSVIRNFDRLPDADKQALLDFLRSL